MILEKQFKKIHGQQFFLVSVIALFYLCIFLFVFLLIDTTPETVHQQLSEYLGTIRMLIVFFIPIFAVIAVIIWAISRLWVEPYATLTDNYMVVDDKKIFYFNIEEIQFIPGSWIGSGRHSSPYGPARVQLYCKDDSVTIEGISYYFFLALKKKCPNATVRYKYFIIIFLIIPVCVATAAAILNYIPEEYW